MEHSANIQNIHKWLGLDIPTLTHTTRKEGLEGISRRLRIMLAVTTAIINVESSGKGYVRKGSKQGKLVLRWEAHIFYRQLRENRYYKLSKKLALKMPNVVSRRRRNPSSVAASYVYLHQALDLCSEYGIDPELVLKSASYGMFQIMGFNHKDSGYESATEMVYDYAVNGEVAQLQSFAVFLQEYRGGKALRYARSGNFRGFSKLYNGSYAYSRKLTREFIRAGGDFNDINKPLYKSRNMLSHVAKGLLGTVGGSYYFSEDDIATGAGAEDLREVGESITDTTADTLPVTQEVADAIPRLDTDRLQDMYQTAYAFLGFSPVYVIVGAFAGLALYGMYARYTDRRDYGV